MEKVEIKIFINDVSIDLVKVNQGTLLLRSNNSFDSPQRDVFITHDFYISKFPITQLQWEIVMNTPPPTKYIGRYRPVDEASYQDCLNFVNQLSKKTGFHFNIPTESQWEFAACGGILSKGYKFAGGNDESLLFSRNEIEDGYQSLTYDVGLFKPNELGIFDMNNNVAEWCMWDKEDILKGGVLGYEGGLIWECCGITERIRESAESYTPNKGIRVILYC